MNRKEIAASAPQSEYQKWTKLRRIWALKTFTRWHSGYSWACSPWLIYLFLLDDHQARTCVPLRKTNRFFILSFLPITIMMMQKGAVKYSSYCGGAGGVNILSKTRAAKNDTFLHRKRISPRKLFLAQGKVFPRAVSNPPWVSITALASLGM